MPKFCQIHGLEMRLIPAGISKKTGKPYNAFYSCPAGDTFPVSPQTSNLPPRSDANAEMVQRLDKMAKWAVNVEKRLQALESLAAFLESEKATELHSSFSPVDLIEPSKPFTIDINEDLEGKKWATEHQGDNQEGSL